MAFLYKVNTANIFVYNTTDRSENNRYLILNKDEQFVGDIVENNTVDDNWRKIVQCPNHTDIVGKYVYRELLSSGENIKGTAYYVANEDYEFVPSNGGGSGGNNGSSGHSGTTGTTEAGYDEYGDPINYNPDGTPSYTGGHSEFAGTYGNDTGRETDGINYELNNSFFEEYVPSISSSAYLNNLSAGLDIKDLRGILGLPHQFSPITDCRLDGSNDKYALGRMFTEKILKTMPLLLITPGVPSFMSGATESQKQSLAEQFFSGNASDSVLSGLVDDYNGKYYSLQYAYVDYFRYVNGMLRSAAVFLGINKEIVNGRQLENFNWLYDASSESSDMWGNSGLGRFLGPYVGCVALYANCGTEINDSFSNGTTQSQLSSTLNSLSDTGREINFLVGNISSLAGLNLTALTGEQDLSQNLSNVQDAVDSMLGSKNIISAILGKAGTILAGGRLVFPEIWSDSSFGRSYTCSMRLVSPSGDKLSVYLNILVPIYHILAMALSRQSVQQAYFSPFLLRCYYKGLFNIDMGIMQSLSITKGAEGEWTVDGFL